MKTGKLQRSMLAWSRDINPVHNERQNQSSFSFIILIYIKVNIDRFWEIVHKESCRAEIVQLGAVDRADAMWKLPSTRNEAHMKWRDDLLNEITKTIVINQDLRWLTANDRVFTCEKHFDPEDLEVCKSVILLTVFRSHFITCVYIFRALVCRFQRSIEVCLDFRLISSFYSSKSIF